MDFTTLCDIPAYFTPDVNVISNQDTYYIFTFYLNRKYSQPKRGRLISTSSLPLRSLIVGSIYSALSQAPAGIFVPTFNIIAHHNYVSTLAAWCGLPTTLDSRRRKANSLILLTMTSMYNAAFVPSLKGSIQDTPRFAALRRRGFLRTYVHLKTVLQLYEKTVNRSTAPLFCKTAVSRWRSVVRVKLLPFVYASNFQNAWLSWVVRWQKLKHRREGRKNEFLYRSNRHTLLQTLVCAWACSGLQMCDCRIGFSLSK